MQVVTPLTVDSPYTPSESPVPAAGGRAGRVSPPPMVSTAARAASGGSGSRGRTAQPRLADDQACDSWMGVCKLGPDRLHRRIDLKGYPRSQYPFAVLYFTGSDHFNRSMRLFARKWCVAQCASVVGGQVGLRPRPRVPLMDESPAAHSLFSCKCDDCVLQRLLAVGQAPGPRHPREG